MAEKNERVQLATADELRGLARRALSLFHAAIREPWVLDKDAQRRSNARYDAAREAMRHCAAAAVLTDDSSLLPDLVRLYEARSERDDDWNDLGAIAGAIGGLLLLLPQPDALVRRLASHDDDELRATVAEWLRPKNEASIAVLDTLAQDATPRVRQAARDALAKVRPVEWWRGKFERDPFTVFTPAEAEAHGPAVKEISALLDEPWYSLRKRLDELAEKVAGLPASIGLALVERMLRVSSMWKHKAPMALPRLIWKWPGGEDVFVKLLAEWVADDESVWLQDTATAILQAAPPEMAMRVALRLVATVFPPWIESDTKNISLEQFYGKVIGSGWPADADPTPLIDAILALPVPPSEYTHDMLGYLEHVLRDRVVPVETKRRLLQILADGPPAERAGHTSFITRLVDDLPVPELRPVAEKLIAFDGPAFTWALRTWMTRCYVPEIDGDPLGFGQRIFDDPRLRAAAMQHGLSMVMFVPLRRGLRAGTLSFDEAGYAMDVIGKLFGGCRTTVGGATRTRIESYAAKHREQTRKENALWLGPESLHGPIAAVEWEAFRAVRRRMPPATVDQWCDAVDITPDGPWNAEDRAIFDLAYAFYGTAPEEEHLARSLVEAIATHGSAAELPLADRLYAAAKLDDDGDDTGKELLQECLQAAYARFGVPLPEAFGNADALASPDDDDDDDDDDWDDEPE